jgi:hypothetical protein
MTHVLSVLCVPVFVPLLGAQAGVPPHLPGGAAVECARVLDAEEAQRGGDGRVGDRRRPDPPTGAPNPRHSPAHIHHQHHHHTCRLR